MTRRTCARSTPRPAMTSPTCSGLTPFLVASAIMEAICASGMPLARTMAAICATFSSGRPTRAAIADICMA